MKLIILITGYIMIVLLSGCTTTPKYNPKLNDLESKIVELSRDCRIDTCEHCIKTDEIVRTVGKPDVAMKMSELPDLLRNDNSILPKETLSQVIEDEMETVYRGYRFFQKTDKMLSDWKKDKEFLELDLWFYAFENGPEIYVSGGWLALSPKSTRYFKPFCFVVDDGKVLFTASIRRPVEIRE